MRLTNIICDRFEQHYYRVHVMGDPPLPTDIEPIDFWTASMAENFVNGLHVSPGYWRSLVAKCPFKGHDFAHNTFKDTDKGRVSRLMFLGIVKLYPLAHLNGQTPDKPPVPFPSLPGVNGTNYTLAPPSALLTETSPSVKTFTDKQQAARFLAGLNLDQAQLNALSTTLGIASPAPANPTPIKTPQSTQQEKTTGIQTPATITPQIAAMAQALADKQFFLLEQPTKITPPRRKGPEDLPVEDSQRTPPSLGPHDEQGVTYSRGSRETVAGAVIAAGTEADETNPPCTLEKVVVKCSHGASVEITKETRSAPSLNVVATETDKTGFDLISAEIQASELCASHKNSNFNLSKEHRLTSKTDNKIEFKVNCAPWNRSNIFGRIWLPSVKPKTYSLAVKNTCEAPDIDVKKVNINVYPAIKWHWSTTIDFGKLEFVPGKAKVKYSDFVIDGNVDVTYDGKKHDAKEKYQEYIKKPLDGFKKICDSVAKVLEVINDPKAALMRIGTQTDKPKPAEGEDNTDGNETRLIIDWPKLNIDYDSTFIENTANHCVDHDYRIKLTAKPLLDIDIQVDVLESMISLAPLPVAELIRYAKKRVEQDFEDDQEVGLRGELDIIFTVKSTININESEIKGRQNAAENNVSVEPVKGDIKIPAKLKGVIDAEGKWFFISFSVNYEMTGDTEWSGSYEFGHDDNGIYFSNTVEFKGIDITLTRYEEVKAKLETEAGRKKKVSVDDFLSSIEVDVKGDVSEAGIKLEEGQVKGEATVRSKEEKRWSWLKPNKDAEKQQPTKHYIVKR